jgi:adenosylcobinamide kinase/adenosylcobinamide-phosphate guanylyltransferase
MHREIIFITGGARSGKSSFAIARSSGIPGRKAYIATAEALDDEMRERISQHKKQRGKNWDTYEVPIRIPEIIKEIQGGYSSLVLDCLTLWLSNLFMKIQSTRYKSDAVETEIRKLSDSLIQWRSAVPHNPDFPGRCSFHIVSNEIGMGIVPESSLSRRFRDMAGVLNQAAAEISDETYLMVSGIPVMVKGKGSL